MRKWVITISYDYSTISDVRITYREYSNIETKVKEEIDWIRQQNTQIESSLGKF